MKGMILPGGQRWCNGTENRAGQKVDDKVPTVTHWGRMVFLLTGGGFPSSSR